MRKSRKKKLARKPYKREYRKHAGGGKEITKAEAVDMAAMGIWRPDFLCKVAEMMNFSSCKSFLKAIEKRKRREAVIRRAFERERKR